jgi:hypothetical protein
MRGMIDEAALMSGSSEKNLQKSDEGRAAIERGLVVQSVFENQEHPLGYPVLNGCGINPDMIKIYPVQPGQTVILATDGYPQICDTLEETEALLKQTLKNDPLCIRVNPSTKGVMSGNDSYDDRTYCRIKV